MVQKVMSTPKTNVGVNEYTVDSFDSPIVSIAESGHVVRCSCYGLKEDSVKTAKVRPDSQPHALVLRK